MTRQAAIDTGEAAAVRFGKPFVVYRLGGWPVDCYGVIACDKGLPREAETFETLQHKPGPVPAVRPSLEATRAEKQSPATGSRSQGSLF